MVCLFAECTAPLGIYEEISLTAWNDTYHYLEMAFNNFSPKKYMCQDFFSKETLGGSILVSDHSSR